MKKSALILIETQNEWMHTNGTLYKALMTDKEMMSESISNIEKALEFARKNYIEVIHVGLRFQDNYPELANGKSGLRKAIPEAGTFPVKGFGSQFYRTLKPIKNEFVVTGRIGASGFTGSNLDAYLRNNKIENLFLVGYATHVCVESTLRDAHDKGYTTFLVSDATSAFKRIQQEYVINEVVHHFGQHITTDEFLLGFRSDSEVSVLIEHFLTNEGQDFFPLWIANAREVLNSFVGFLDIRRMLDTQDTLRTVLKLRFDSIKNLQH